jgi:hypothetical protein
MFEICYMITMFPKRMLRATGGPIRIERLIKKIVCRKSCKEKKVHCKN